MSTAVAPRNGVRTPANQENTISYMPLGGKATVELTISMVRKFLCVPTRQGNYPSDSEIVKFMMLCRSRELDPWCGDAYLIGYDSQNGPQFSLITAVQALLKRAEISPQFDGIESGLVVQTGNGIEHREGALALEGESIVGGWAKVYRKDRKIPYSATVKFSTFNTGKSQWNKDPAGMIVKCAKAAALREAFPTQLAGLYTDDEMGEISRERLEKRGSGGSQIAASSLNEIADVPDPQQHQQRQDPADDAPALTFSESDLADFGAVLEGLTEPDDFDAAVRNAMTKKRNDADREALLELVHRRKKAIRGPRSNKQGNMLDKSDP